MRAGLCKTSCIRVGVRVRMASLLLDMFKHIFFYLNILLLCSSHNKDWAAGIAYMSFLHIKVQGIYIIIINT